MRAQRNVYLDIDKKDPVGLWIRSWIAVEAGEKIQYHTLSSARWRGIQNRCKPGGIVQRRRPTYIGCTNGFESFQAFAEWCQAEPGHFDVDANGRRLQLDKDLILPGNKEYSARTCCFVPSQINQLMVFPSSRMQSNLPIGCSFHSQTKQYYAYINGPGQKTIHLGNYRSAIEAHRAWQAAKIAAIRNAARSMPPHLHRSAAAILSIAAQIEIDLSNMQESKF